MRQLLTLAAASLAIALAPASHADDGLSITPAVYLRASFSGSSLSGFSGDLRLNYDNGAVERLARPIEAGYRAELQPGSSWSVGALAALHLTASRTDFVVGGVPLLLAPAPWRTQATGEAAEGATQAGGWGWKGWALAGLGVVAAAVALGGSSDDSNSETGPGNVDCSRDVCIVPCDQTGPVQTCNNGG